MFCMCSWVSLCVSNVAFKLARGEIVNSVDADNFVNKDFADFVNRLANEQPEKAIFAKGKKMLRGRLGFYKEEFINILGGYDEEIIGYGHEDHDLLHRAYCLNFKLMWYGGGYYTPIEGHKKHQTENFTNKDWRFTESRNKLISFFSLYCKRFKAHKYQKWGCAKVIKNNEEEIILN